MRAPFLTSIRGRLLALNLLVAIPLVLLAAWHITGLWRQALSDGHSAAQEIADRVAADLAGLLRDRELALAAIAERPLVRAMDPRVCDPLFDSMSDFYPELTAVTVRDRDGRLVCSTLPFAPQSLPPDLMDAFRQGVESGRLEVSGALFAGMAGVWVTAMSHPIEDAAGAVAGLLITPIDLASLAERLAPNTPTGVVVTVLDRKRQVLLRSEDMARWVGQQPPPELAALAEDGDSRFRGSDSAGRPRIGSFVAIPRANWIVASSLPEDTLLGPVRSAIAQLTALGLLVLGGLGVVTHRTYRQIVRSTDNLERLAGAIGAGRTDARAEVTGPPELAAIAGHMNAMLDTLQANVERFRLVAEASNSVIWDNDLVAGEVWYSDNIGRLFGYDVAADRAALQDWQGLAHPDDRASVAEWTRAALGGAAETVSKPFRLRRRDGSYAEIRAHARILRDAAGKAIRVIGAWSDETQFRALDRQLRQFQRLEVVGQLTGGVAHDFNNLLTVILGNSELLSNELQGQPELRKLAEIVVQAAQRGSDLTRSLLAFSRNQQLTAERCDVARLIDGLEPLLRRTLPANVALEIAAPADLWAITVDPALFENALLNLCLNARDAMPGGGRLSIAAANHLVGPGQLVAHPGARAGEHVAIAIADDGQGMAPDVLSRVFEPFFTTKEPGKGTGLGLSMVYGFVRQSDGFIEVASEPGLGTRITLYFPRSRAPAAEPPGERPPTATGGAEHILVVEDDALVRDGVVTRLTSLGYRVSTAANAAEALEILERTADIDLVLTDIVMPGAMDGRQLARHIRTTWPAIRVILTSGYAKESAPGEERPEAGLPFLAKPYRRQELAAKLRQVLEAA